MRHSHAGRIVLLIAVAALTGGPAHSQTPFRPPGEKYALLVGVRKYDKSSELRELQYPERDMDELAKVLREGGYRPENIVLMTGTAGSADTRFLPTVDHIRQELKALLRDRIEADSVLVAFAGHGVQFRGSDESYFCPADARPDNTRTLLSLKEVYQALAECEARFKLLLSDACRNDPISTVSRRASVNLDSVTRPQLQRPPGGVAALFSCSEGELAYESDTLKHGVFFHFVIEGLRGAADFDKDQQIGLEELTFFAKRRVLDFVRAEYDGLRQMPVLKGEVGGLPDLISLNGTKVSDVAKAVRTIPQPKVIGTTSPAAKPIKALIITGDNVTAHDWKGTTQMLQDILGASGGRIKVYVTSTPAKDLTDDNLAKYNVLILNYKETKDGSADTQWSDANRAAFLKAVKGGKGLVVHHFASAAFSLPNWKEFEQAIGGGWRYKQGFHGPKHEFSVKKTDVKHPISEGTPSEFKHVIDELYQNSLMLPGNVVLATAYSDPNKLKGTGKDEAVIWVNQFGKGRVFHNVLGHDTTAMADKNYQEWMKRGVEWAATGEASSAGN